MKIVDGYAAGGVVRRRCGLGGLLVTTSVLATSLAVPGALAQGVGAENDETRVEETIFVTAQRREQSVQDVPIAIDLFDGERLNEAGFSDVEDLQFIAPGLQIGGFQNRINIALRGITSTENFVSTTSGTAVHFDGIYLQDRRGFTANYYDLNRVEVLRGPQGTLYGRSSTGGTINVITNKPDPDLGGALRATAGNFGLIEVEGHANVPLGDELLSRVAFKYAKSDGYGENLFAGASQGVDNVDLASIRASLRWLPSDDVTWDASLSYSKDSHSDVMYASRFIESSPTFGEANGGFLPAERRTINTNFDDRVDDTVLDLRSELNWRLGEVEITSLSGYREIDAALNVDFGGTEIGDLEQPQVSGGFQVSQEIILTDRGDDAFSWVTGANYFHYDSDIAFSLFFLGNPPTAATENAFEGTSYAVFFDGSYDLTDRLQITGGLRYSNDETQADQSAIAINPGARPSTGSKTLIASTATNSDAVTARGVISYNMTEDAMIYGSVSRGYKAGGSGTAIDAPWEPEFVWNYELGAKSSLFDDQLGFNLTAFYSDYTDLQVRTFVDDPTQVTGQRLVPTNAASSTIWGVEMSMDAQLTDAFSVFANSAYLNAKYDELIAPDTFNGNVATDVSGNRIIGAPEWSGNFGARYTWRYPGNGSVTATAEHSFRSEVFLDPLQSPLRADPFARTGVRLSYLNEAETVEVAAWVRNIEDNDDVSFKQIIPVFNLQRDSFLAPRTFGFTIGYSF